MTAVAGGPEGLMVLELLFIFNPATVNPDSGYVAWPGGVDLCPDAMHQAMTGAESESEVPLNFGVKNAL